MKHLFKSEKDLVNALHGLPKSVKPRSGLWRGIEQRLTPRVVPAAKAGRPAWRAQAVAAMVAVTFVAGILLGRQLPRHEAPGEPIAGGPAGLSMLAAMEASEREYQAAFREFIPVGFARSSLEIDAVENIEHSWFELQQAESSLLAALDEYPRNAYLNEKLMDLRAQQLEFMRQLAMLDQNSRRKI